VSRAGTESPIAVHVRTALRLKFLLIFIPIAVALDRFGANPIVVFLASAAAIVPLSRLIGEATEDLSLHLGETWGGLLNATMGNLPEMIIGVLALQRGLPKMVKASISGSILGNVLLNLGLALIAGGARYNTLRFNVHLVALNSKLLLLATVGLIVPALFHFTASVEDRLSIEIASILFLAYLASLAFTLFTHRQLFVGDPSSDPSEPPETVKGGGIGRSIAKLAVTAAALGVTSEVLTGALEPTAKMMGLSEIFAGIFLLAPVGNCAELLNAVGFARKGKLDLTMGITLGAATQVALLVAPVLIFASPLVGQPMDLLFSQFEVVAIAVTVFVGQSLTSDGESNWLEGLMLIAVYAMLGFGFYHM
jgi:Ca2+:H+ antiporter